MLRTQNIRTVLFVLQLTTVIALKYSAEDTRLINQLRHEMGDELSQSHDYMQSDDFLVRWLRVKNMDVENAKGLLQRNLDWRKRNNIDGILDENLAPFPNQYKVRIGGSDNFGRPLLVLYFGSWDIRKAVIGGPTKTDKFHRFLVERLEYSSQLIRQANSSSPYNNITQAVVVFDATGYNLRQHGCLACIPQYVRFLNNLESYYPLLPYKIFIVNAPAVAEAVLLIVRELLNPESRKAFTVYGLDKNQWSGELLKLVSVEQLPARLGGNAPNNFM